MSKTKRLSRKKKFLNARRIVASAFIVSGLVLFGVSLLLWQSKQTEDPETVFWNMIDNSLSSSSVTRQVIVEQGGSNLIQTRQAAYSPALISETYTRVEQIGEGTTDTIHSRLVSTKSDDYIRYETLDLAPYNGKELDFSNALNKWGRQKIEDGNVLSASIAESVLNIIPFGPLTPAAKSKLINSMRENKVYGDVSTAMPGVRDGRKILTYSLQVPTRQYVEMLQEYSELLGYGDLSELNAESFAVDATTPAEISIDATNHQLVSLSYQEDSRIEVYSGQGLRLKPSIPTESIDFTELQQQLDAAYQTES